MCKVVFSELRGIDDSKIHFVTCAARYQNKWVFSRHKYRTTWDMPGGHRENGETPHDAMLRELWEETGALESHIQPLCIYNVMGDLRFGMLFYADIKRLGKLPADYEMAEIALEDALPQSLTYPEILTELFSYTQGWLNRQCSAQELWDIYDGNRNLTGRKHQRGNPLPLGEYHLVVHVWMLNSEGRFLLTKRSPNKGFPNMWETTGGSALAGENSLSAAIREVNEETALILQPDNGNRILTGRKEDYFWDIWLFKQDFDLRMVVLHPEETTDVMYADVEDIQKLRKSGLLVPYDYLEELFSIAGL